MADNKSSTHKQETTKDAQCAYFLKKKSRFCRFKPKEHEVYCPEHSLFDSSSVDDKQKPNVRKRIVCPLNPKHSCYEDQVKRHLKKCPDNNAALLLQPYFSKGLNSGARSDIQEPSPKATVLTSSVEELKTIIDKVNELYDDHVKSVEIEVLSHPCLRDEVENPSYGAPAIKHRKQQASLIGHIEKLGLLQKGHCYLEMGAGKGGMSHWVQQALGKCQDTLFLLIDKGHVRYKFDLQHRFEEHGPKFERIRIDIEDLNLIGVPQIHEGNHPIVAYGKHLCGAATDLALRCSMETLMDSCEPSCSKKPKAAESYCDGQRVAGVVVALCCHHRCTWTSYVGKTFMSECDISPTEFQLLTSLSSWATCTWTGLERAEEKESRNDNTNSDDTRPQTIDNYKEEHAPCDDGAQRGGEKLSPEEREQIGIKCKRLIDMGRVKYMQDLNYNCHLLKYIDWSLTPENVAIIAKPISGDNIISNLDK